MPSPGGQPLHVAPAEAGGRAERVGVVDQAPAHVGDGLEAPVRVVGEARHVAAVVHPPAVEALEVLAQVPPLERHRRPRHLVARRVGVVVVHAEQERVDRRPLEPQRHGLEHRVSHARQATGVAPPPQLVFEPCRSDARLANTGVGERLPAVPVRT